MAGLCLMVLLAGSDDLSAQTCTDVPVHPGRVGFSLRIIWYDLQFDSALPRGTIEAIHGAFKTATEQLGAGSDLQFRLAVTDEQKNAARIDGIRLTNGPLDRSRNEAAAIDMLIYRYGDSNPGSKVENLVS